MKTKTYTVYSFDELTPKAKQRALDKEREMAGQDNWYESTREDAKAMLRHAGFDVKDIYFNGFSSQGDGACFVGSWHAADVDPNAMRANAPIDEELNRIAGALADVAKNHTLASFDVQHSGHYYHEYCTDFDFSEVSEDVEKQLIELARDAMRWIYKQLNKEHDWQSADKQLIESIEARECEFTESGEID